MNWQLSNFLGIIVSALVLLFILLIIWLCKWKEQGPYNFDPLGKAGGFEKFPQIYIDIMKLVIGLASGSVVLLTGLSSFRESGQLLALLASPLYLLAASILYGLLSMTFLTLNYESYRHETKPYTKFQYIRNLALGVSCLMCFLIGYVWLIFVVTSSH